MSQLDLFRQTTNAATGRREYHPYVASSATSRAAAESLDPNATRTLQDRVEALICDSEDGLTDEEIIDAIGGNPNGIRPRRVELVRAGIVRDSGRTRSTVSGRSAVVWVAVCGRGEE